MNRIVKGEQTIPTREFSRLLPVVSPPPRMSVGINTTNTHLGLGDEMESKMKDYMMKTPLNWKCEIPPKILYDIDNDLSHSYPEPSPYPKNVKDRVYPKRKPSEPVDFYPGIRTISDATHRNVESQTTANFPLWEPIMKRKRFVEIGVHSQPNSLLHKEFLDLKRENSTSSPIKPKFLEVQIENDHCTKAKEPKKRKVSIMNNYKVDWVYHQKILTHSKFLRRVYTDDHLLSDWHKKAKPELLTPTALVHSPWLPVLTPFGTWFHPDSPQDTSATQNSLESKSKSYCICNNKVLQMQKRITVLERLLNEKDEKLKLMGKKTSKDTQGYNEYIKMVNKRGNEVPVKELNQKKHKMTPFEKLDKMLPNPPPSSSFSFIDLTKSHTVVREGLIPSDLPIIPDPNKST